VGKQAKHLAAWSFICNRLGAAVGPNNSTLIWLNEIEEGATGKVIV
jgi:hypothetical protein